MRRNATGGVGKSHPPFAVRCYSSFSRKRWSVFSTETAELRKVFQLRAGKSPTLN